MPSLPPENAATPLEAAHAVDPTPTGMAAHVLDRAAEQLHGRYPEVGDVELVRELLHDSYATLARTSRHPDMLAGSAVNYTTARLRALAIRQGSLESTEPRVLFVCHGNAGRSQMAAALLENRSDGAVAARSGGTSPAGEVLPLALEAMSEIGIPLHQAYTKGVDQDVLATAELVVLFDGADELAVPAGIEVRRWAVPSLRGLTIEQVRAVRDDVDVQVRALIAELAPEQAAGAGQAAGAEQAAPLA